MPSRLHDMNGKTVGLWTVMSRGTNRRHQAYWLCQCTCGAEREILGSSLRMGDSLSCGCRNRRAIHNKRARQREYRVWEQMKSRCLNPRHKRYSRYGGRGISICDRWRLSFAAFMTDMGPCPPGRSIDRIDNDGNYAPHNCAWVTPRTQTLNRSIVRWVVVNGRRMCLAEWCREFHVSPKTAYKAMASGLSAQAAVESILAARGFR